MKTTLESQPTTQANKWRPHKGPQEFILRQPPSVKENLYGGQRGGGKTDAGMIWVGNRRWKDQDGNWQPVFKHPKYRALVIRKNADDLSDWIERFRFMYPNAKIGYQPAVIRFPSGAIIRTGHLKDEQAYTKYQGHEYHSILIEELTQIPTEKRYVQLISSCRSTVPELRPQIFNTTNPGGHGHCVPHGEVLTRHGWVSIADVEVGEEVATIDDKLKFIPVEQVHRHHYDGDLLELDSSTKYMIATPNHSIAVVTETKNKDGRTFHSPSLREFDSLAEVTRTVHGADGYVGQPIDEFSVEGNSIHYRALRVKQPLKMSGNDFAEFMGWYLSEGSAVDRDKAISIAQMKPDNRQRIKHLLDRIGFTYSSNSDGFVIYSPQWWEYLKQFGKSRDKHVPSILKNASQDQLRIFHTAAMLGDGHGKIYYTISSRLADDMQEIGVKLGYDVKQSSRQRNNRKGLSYEIRYRNNRLGWVEKKNIVRKPYSGMIYDIGVRNHKFLIRQNGCIWLSGNSWVKSRFVDPAPPFTVFSDENGNHRIYVPAGVEDNPTLMKVDPDYVKQLDAIKRIDPDLYKAWRLGSWDVIAGQVFREFNQEYHVSGQFDFSLEVCEKLIAFDWGFQHKAVAHWIALTPENKDGFRRAYIYREIAINQTNPEQWAKMIKKYTDVESVRGIVLPHDCFAQKHTKVTIASTFAKDIGINVIRGETLNAGARLNRKATMHRYLSAAPDGKPYLIIHPSCRELITTLPLLQYDERNIEDVAKQDGDDAYDAASLGLITLPYHPVKSTLTMPKQKITTYPTWHKNRQGQIPVPNFWKAFDNQRTRSPKDSEYR